MQAACWFITNFRLTHLSTRLNLVTLEAEAERNETKKDLSWTTYRYNKATRTTPFSLHCLHGCEGC